MSLRTSSTPLETDQLIYIPLRWMGCNKASLKCLCWSGVYATVRLLGALEVLLWFDGGDRKTIEPDCSK